MTVASTRHLVHVFSTFAPGGPQMRVVNVLRSLPARFRHTILATNHDLSARAHLPADAPIEYLQAPRAAGEGVRRGELRRLLAEACPDLILTYNWGATDAILVNALRAVAPILHAEDGFGPDESEAQLARRVWARRLLLRFVEAVVVPSRNLEEIAHRTWWLPRRRVLYVANGIDVARFAPEGARGLRAALSIPEDAFVVGTVAHLRGEKNPLRLLRAFARGAPPGAHLVFVGEGPERAALETQARVLGVADRLRFAGFLADPAPAYRSFDLFALSSDTEQMPVSVLEAMGSGLPVLSTDVGDVRSMVAPANADCVTALGDEPAYVDALARLAADPVLRSRLGAANRTRCIAHYSLHQQNAAYLDLYERFSSGRAGAWTSEHFRG